MKCLLVKWIITLLYYNVFILKQTYTQCDPVNLKDPKLSLLIKNRKQRGKTLNGPRYIVTAPPSFIMLRLIGPLQNKIVFYKLGKLG